MALFLLARGVMMVFLLAVLAVLALLAVGCGGPAGGGVDLAGALGVSGPALPATSTPWPTFTPVPPLAGLGAVAAPSPDVVVGPTPVGYATPAVVFLPTVVPTVIPTVTPRPTSTPVPAPEAPVVAGGEPPAVLAQVGPLSVVSDVVSASLDEAPGAGAEVPAADAVGADAPGGGSAGATAGAGPVQVLQPLYRGGVGFERHVLFPMQVETLPDYLLNGEIDRLPITLSEVPSNTPFIFWFVGFDFAAAEREFEMDVSLRWFSLGSGRGEQPLLMHSTGFNLTAVEPYFYSGLGAPLAGSWPLGQYLVEILDDQGDLISSWYFDVI